MHDSPVSRPETLVGQASFSVCTDILRLVPLGQRVVDVPVTIQRRTAGVTKKGTDLRYGLGFLRVMLKTRLR